MATSSVPTGNAAGNNQANPAFKAAMPTAGATSSPIPGGSTPSSNNPFMLGVGTGAATSGSVPGSSPSTPLPTNFTYTDPSVLPGTDPGQQQLTQKQFIDIAGKGTGGQLAQQYAGMAGTDSAIFQQWMQGQAPVWQQQRNTLEQSLGAGGVSPNSTVASLGLADLGAQQAAQAGSMNAQLMQTNQQNQLNILSEMLNPSIKEVASSGWDVFGNVMNAISAVEGAATGHPQMFHKQGEAADASSVATGMGDVGGNIGSLFDSGGGGSSTGGSVSGDWATFA